MVRTFLLFSLIIALTVGIYFLLRNGLWFSSLIVLLSIIGIIVYLYRMQARQIQHQYNESLLNKVNTAVLITNMQGSIEWMNRSAVLQLGETPQLTRDLLMFLAGDTSVLRVRSGDRVLEMAADSTVFITGGREHRLITLKDIHTALERNEMEAWQKLISVLTHEIMNSLTPILSISETLSEGSKEYSIMLQAMQTIHRRSKGLLEFVENYRRLTRLPQPVRTEVPIRELFADLQKLYPQPCVHIEFPASDRTLFVDRTQIEQVLINLLKNALEATERIEKPVITVRASFALPYAPYRCTLTVCDNGEGILPEVQDKIFVPFFTTKPSGSGIGLSLCKQILTLHGGVISVSSERGKGSCFTLQV
jgi:signal transduction histidine kinase